MSTSVVLGLFTAVSVAAIAGIMGAAVWARARSNREDLEDLDPTIEYGIEYGTAVDNGHGLFSDSAHQPGTAGTQSDHLVDARADTH